ncbi:MAG TPA: VOC family protein [Solirubrobacteraceae bacterium]|nr:VOC family protein [Solirubrobacteraceae bacterium]
MSERDGFQHGVPCWVDLWQDEIPAAFYTGLFGWEAQVGDEYTLFQHRGLDVAGAGTPAAGGGAWTTYVWVDDVDAVAERAVAAGGSLAREPFDSLDGGRMAIVDDPAGATFGVWQPGEHRGARVVNEPGAWSMSFLSTPDPEGAKAFYEAVFGWTAASEFGPATMLHLPGFVGGEPSQPVARDVVAVMMQGEQAAWNVGFWAEDVDVAAQRAQELGGAVLSPPTDTPFGRSAVLADPAGAVISIDRPAALGPPRT